MVAAPFIKDSDDQTSQLAQAQIFFSLVSSIGLRMHPPNETLGSRTVAPTPPRHDALRSKAPSTLQRPQGSRFPRLGACP